MANTLPLAVFTFTVVACALVGLAIGSFLNVVIYRVPAGQSLVRPASTCPACGSTISPRDNIPVLSWLLLHGRCRSCSVPISARYPIIEALTAALFALTAARLGASATLPAELVFVAGLVALAAIDLERYLLPRAIVYPTLALVTLAALGAAASSDEWRRLWIAVMWGVGAFACFAAIHFARPAWLGFGDVRLAGLIGLALGWVGPWYPVVSLIAANLLGAAVGIALMALGRATRKTALPYGVFLAAGSVFALLAASPIIAWYGHHLVR